MRKYISILCLALFAAVSVQAAEKNDTPEKFYGRWNIQVQGGVGHTTGETDFGKLISPAAAFSFGYQFTPVWELRANFTGWQAKGAIVNPATVYKFNYAQVGADVKVDLCGIAGYKERRLFNPYLFAGVAAACGFNNDEAASIMTAGAPATLLWEDNLITPVGRFGLGLDIRLAKTVYFNLEANANMMSDKFNSKEGSKLDWQLQALAGLTFKFEGKKEKAMRMADEAMAKAAAEEAERAAAEAAAAAEAEAKAKAEAEAAARAAAEEKAAAEAKAAAEEAERQAIYAQYVGTTDNVFFQIGKAEIRENEATKIASMVEILNKAEIAKILVTGYADKETGTEERNMELSKERAENVAAALKAAGISEDRIIVDYKGSTERPYKKASENRVAIMVVK